MIRLESPTSRLDLNGFNETIDGIGGEGGVITGSGTLYLNTEYWPGFDLWTSVVPMGNLYLKSGATIYLEIYGPTPGTEYDQTQVTGTLTLQNAVLDLVTAPYDPPQGTSFTIFTNDGTDPVNGKFIHGDFLHTAGMTFAIDYQGGDGNDVVLTRAPDTPTATAATLEGDHTFTANWNPAAGAASYRLDVSTNSSFTVLVPGYNDRDVGNVTTFQVTGLTSGTTYYYRVRGHNGVVAGDNSNTITTATTGVAPTPAPPGTLPETPQAVSATGVRTSAFTANWSGVGNAEVYELQVACDVDFIDFDWGGFDAKSVGLVTSFRVTGLRADWTYYFRVRARNDLGTSSWSNIIQVRTSSDQQDDGGGDGGGGGLQPPTVVQGSGPNPTGGGGGPSLTWPPATGASSYRVYRADCPTCPQQEVGQSSGTSFSDPNAQPGQVYYYWLQSQNDTGVSDFSNWLAAWYYEANPGRPGDFNGDGISDLLWWDPTTGQLQIWFMAGGQVVSVSNPSQGRDLSSWLLMDTGDYNGDAIWDIMWRNPATGQVEIWYGSAGQYALNNTDAWSSQTGQIPGNATISFAGDVNGDGRDDIVWRDCATGQVKIWLLKQDGTLNYQYAPILAQDMVGGDQPGVEGSLSWSLRGFHDMDGDQRADLVWQHTTDGRVVIWYTDGVFVLRKDSFQHQDPEGWRIAGLGDLNSDGHGDIIWRNCTTGQVRAWLMTGADPAYETREITISDQDPAHWQIKAVDNFCQTGGDDLYCQHDQTGQARIVTLDGQAFTPSAE